MSQNDEFFRPYQKAKDAEDLIERGSLLDLYVSEYKKKYRNEPIFPVDNIHFKQIKDLHRLAKDKSYDVITHYFEMKDEWFTKQCHSIKCLIDNINQVMLSMSRHGVRARAFNSSHIETKLYCDCCWVGFTKQVPLDFDYNKTIRCTKCEKENRPIKTVSKEERRRTVEKLGRIFPDLPRELYDAGRND